MICPSCGENNPEGAPTCSSCGHGLEAWAPTQIARLPTAAVPSSPGSAEPTASVAEATAAGAPAASGGAAVSASSGNVIAGRYKIIAQLGRGGVGVVYRAVDMELGEEIALKVLTISERDPAELDRVRREVKVARNITHPNVIRIYEFGTAGADAFISMQLLPGGTLAQRIDGGVTKIEEAIDIAIGICDGLAAAHELGIVHRDIKPENVLFDAAGRPKLVDFGLARFANATTRTVGFSGTPFYMSPEQADGGEITVRSDVYSLGVLLFELFTGRLPFVADSLVRLAMMHVKEAPPLPKSIRPDLPDEIEDMILRALEKDPAKRYQSVADLGDDLKSWRESSIGPYTAARTGDHVRPGAKPRTTGEHAKVAPPKKGERGDVTKTPILESEGDLDRGNRRDVIPRGGQGASDTTVPGVMIESAGRTRSSSADQTQIRAMPADAPSRSHKAVTQLPPAVESAKSRAPLYAAGVAGLVFIGLAGAALSGAFSPEKPAPTPLPTQVARASATPTPIVATTATPFVVAATSTPAATPGRTPTPEESRATPRPTTTRVAVASTPAPTPKQTSQAARSVEVRFSFVAATPVGMLKVDGQTPPGQNGFFAGPFVANLRVGEDHELLITHDKATHRVPLRGIDRDTEVVINLREKWVRVGRHKATLR